MGKASQAGDIKARVIGHVFVSLERIAGFVRPLNRMFQRLAVLCTACSVPGRGRLIGAPSLRAGGGVHARPYTFRHTYLLVYPLSYTTPAHIHTDTDTCTRTHVNGGPRARRATKIAVWVVVGGGGGDDDNEAARLLCNQPLYSPSVWWSHMTTCNGASQHQPKKARRATLTSRVGWTGAAEHAVGSGCRRRPGAAASREHGKGDFVAVVVVVVVVVRAEADCR